MIPGENEIWARFERAKVSLDVTKPFCQTINLSLTNGDVRTLLLKYEKLSHICFFNGILGHIEENCLKLKELQNIILSEYPKELHQTLINLLELKINEEIKISCISTGKKPMGNVLSSMMENVALGDSQKSPLTKLGAGAGDEENKLTWTSSSKCHMSITNVESPNRRKNDKEDFNASKKATMQYIMDSLSNVNPIKATILRGKRE